MKVFLLHGDDNIKSLDRLIKFTDEARKRKMDVIYLDESPLSLAENISSMSLFSEKRFFIHRDFSKVSKNDLTWLKKNGEKYSDNLVFYLSSQAGKTAINALPKNLVIEEFKLPTLIWRFLDSFYPGNSKNILLMFHEIVKNEPAELVMGLLARQLRDLFWIKTDTLSLNYPSWRLGKLKSQSSKFDLKSLESIISDLAQADVKSKSSADDLISLLDFIITTRLEYS